MRLNKLTREEVVELIHELRKLPTERSRSSVENNARIRSNWQAYRQLSKRYGISADSISSVHTRRLYSKVWQDIEALEECAST